MIASPAPSTPAGDAPLTLADLAAILWRRRWLALPVAVVTTALALVVLLRQTPLFEAHASLAIDKGNASVSGFQTDPDNGRIEFSLLNTQRDMLQSNVVLRGALAASGAEKRAPYSESQDPAGVLAKRLKITTSRDSWVIDVAVRDETADGATTLLQAIIDAYLSQQVRLKGKQAESALTFLSTQVATARERLEQARTAEQEFRAKNGIIDADPEKNIAVARVQQLSQQRSELEASLAQAMAAVAQVDDARRSATTPNEQTDALLRINSINQDPQVVQQLAQLYDLQDKATLLGQKFLAKHPRMAEMQEMLAEKHRHLGLAVAAATAGLTVKRDEIVLQLKSLEERVALAEKELTGYRASLIQLAALTEERQTRQNLAEQLITGLSREEVASRLNASQVAVVDPPQAGVKPANIKPLLFVAAALVAGLMAGLAAGLGANALDRRVRGATDAMELTGQPILVAVPHFDGLKPLGSGGDPSKPTELAEALRGLRAALRLASQSGGSRVYVITSCGPGEGKSTVSSRLALSLASAGVRTVLIDADMRRPTAHLQLGVASERGLSFRLAGEVEVEPQPSGYAHLDIMPAGVRPPNPGELLSRPELQSLVASLRQRYDAIIIDTPPLGLVADALPCAELADGILLVVRDRKTLRGTARRIVGQFGPLAVKLLGIVLNDEKASAGGYYGYGYSYGYGYGANPYAAASGTSGRLPAATKT